MDHWSPASFRQREIVHVFTVRVDQTIRRAEVLTRIPPASAAALAGATLNLLVSRIDEVDEFVGHSLLAVPDVQLLNLRVDESGSEREVRASRGVLLPQASIRRDLRAKLRPVRKIELEVSRFYYSKCCRGWCRHGD